MKLLVRSLKLDINDSVLMTNYEDLMRKYFEAVIETYSIFMKVDDDDEFVINRIIAVYRHWVILATSSSRELIYPTKCVQIIRFRC
jgi:hypothetical protein